MYCLSKHPDLQHALRSELRSWRNEEVSAPDPNFDQQLKSRTLNALPLLDDILMETLRLHTSNPGPWPRYTLERSTQIGTCPDIPPNMVFSASSYCLHRNEDVFPDAEKWRPERWSEADPKKHKQMMEWFWAFGSGSRICLGKSFAVYTIKAMIAAVYFEFETRVIDDGGMEQIDGVVAGPAGGKCLLSFHRI